jgi:hypothetical protein
MFGAFETIFAVLDNYLFNKKGKLFHTNFIFRVEHRDGSSRGLKGWGSISMTTLKVVSWDQQQN